MRRTAVFLLAILVTAMVADRAAAIVLDHLYRLSREGESGGKINYFLALERVPTVTIFGNSRALGMIDPQVFTVPAFNLAHSGMALSSQVGLLSVLRHERKLSPVILLNIDPTSFVYKDVDVSSTWDTKRLRYYYGRDPVVTEYISEISPFERFKYLFQLYRFNGNVIGMMLHAIRRAPAPARYDGFMPLPQTPQDAARTAYSARLQRDLGTQVSPSERRFLTEFIQIARDSRVTLVCVTGPFYRDAGAVEYWRSIDAGRRFLSTFLAERRVQWIDMSDPGIPELTNPGVWAEANHLNQTGAGIFSRALVARLRDVVPASLGESNRTR